MASTIDQQFIEYIVKSIVGDPDAVKIERRIDEKGVLLELTVAPDDLGRVIGKRGATAQSLRTLLRALGTKNDARYNLKIIDVGGPRPAPTTSPDDAPKKTSKAKADDRDEDKPADVSSATKDDDNDDDELDSLGKAGKQTLADRTRAELAELDDLDV